MLKNPFKKNSIANEYQTLVAEINSLESKFQTLTDSEIRLKTNQLRKQYQASPDLTNITAEAFALTREASVRTLGLRHYDVQLIGGLVLNSGIITLQETTTPVALTNYGKIYTKDDNLLYFQDGAGTEYTITMT